MVKIFFKIPIIDRFNKYLIIKFKIDISKLKFSSFSPLYLIEDYSNEIKIEISNNLIFLLPEEIKCLFENKAYEGIILFSNKTIIICQINIGLIPKESLK